MKKKFLLTVAVFCMTAAVLGCDKKTDDIPTIGTMPVPTAETETTTKKKELYMFDVNKKGEVTILQGMDYSVEELIIPDTYNGMPVVDIMAESFDNYESLKRVVWPDSVSVIKKEMFSDCKNLVSVEIPEGVTEIETWAFRKCTSLERIELPNTLEKLGSGCFIWCSSLEEIIIPEGITELGQICMCCSSLKRVTIPGSVVKLEGSFEECSSLESIVIPEGVEYIGDRTFSGCSMLREITLPASLTGIHEEAFREYSGERGGMTADNLKGITVYAPAGSYAEQWARDMGCYVIIR